MVQLNRSMMERYEIPDRRPQTLRALIFGAGRLMLGGVARMLDQANEAGADVGACCVTGQAAALNAQDGMFTLRIGGEDADGQPVRSERVVQSVLMAVDPGKDYRALLERAQLPELEFMFVEAQGGSVQTALLARALYARWQADLPAPEVILVAEHAGTQTPAELTEGLRLVCADWGAEREFFAWLEGLSVRAMLCDTLCGRLDDAEAAREQRRMNYRDDFLAWAELYLNCVIDGEVPHRLRAACAGGDVALALERKSRILDAAMFLCTAAGFLWGADDFAGVLADAELRAWIGHAFFDELLPALPWSREEVAPEVISAFGRLENHMNRMPLLAVGEGAMRNFRHALLPTIRSHADAHMEAPGGLTLGLSAAIMLFAGARQDEGGEYEVLRGDARFALRDDPEILEAFSSLAHDMPADTLAYAALADRSIWGCDLREVPGLEMRVAYDLSAIQRSGFRESLRRRLKEWA